MYQVLAIWTRNFIIGKHRISNCVQLYRPRAWLNIGLPREAMQWQFGEMEFGEMKRNTSNWSNFGMLLRRAGLTASAELSCFLRFQFHEGFWSPALVDSIQYNTIFVYLDLTERKLTIRVITMPKANTLLYTTCAWWMRSQLSVWCVQAFQWVGAVSEIIVLWCGAVDGGSSVCRTWCDSLTVLPTE